MRALLLVLAAVAVGAVAGLLLLGRGDDLPPPDAEGAPGATMRVHTSVEPEVARFAEPVTVEAEFVVDTGRVVPASVRLEANAEPFTIASATRSQTRSGDLARILYRYRLTCTSAPCLPVDGTLQVQLEPGRVVYARRDVLGGGTGSVRSQDTVEWPPVQIVSRLGPGDVERARWRAVLADLPPLTERASPAVLGAALLGGSLLLALLGAGLLSTQLRPRRAAPALAAEEQRVTDLERALAGVVAASSNGADGDDRRRSLERLARELAATGRPELAGRARRLAWSPRPAPRPEVDSLAADVRAVVEEER